MREKIKDQEEEIEVLREEVNMLKTQLKKFVSINQNYETCSKKHRLIISPAYEASNSSNKVKRNPLTESDLKIASMRIETATKKNLNPTLWGKSNKKDRDFLEESLEDI